MKNPLPRFELALLGPPELRLAGATVTGQRWPRLLQLLAYVALEGPVGRKAVAALLWPGVLEPRAQANLRQLLHLLRKQAGDAAPSIWADAGEGLLLSEYVACDAVRLLDGAGDGESDYPGEFLAGLPLSEGAFQTWAEGWRLRLRAQAGRLFQHRAENALERGDSSLALQAACRFADICPDDEDAVRALMRRFLREGRSDAAGALYGALEEALPRDFGRIPTVESRQLGESLRGARERASDELEWRQIALLLVAMGEAPGGRDEFDEESQASLADRFMGRLQDLLVRFGAHVIAVPGGLTIAYFGYPLGIERSLHNAWRALREIKRGLPELAEARCVLHCGKALASRRIPDSSGRLTNLAIRLGERLPPGGVLISEAAQSLLALPGGQPFLGGNGLPVAYLLGEDGSGRSSAKTPPCLGREQEIELLRSQYQVSRNGALAAVLITGEAGIGKTRLTQALRVATGNTWLEARCDPLFGETPFHPLLEMIARNDAGEAHRGLRELVAQQLPDVPLVWRAAAADHPLPDNAEARAVLLENLARLIRLAAARQPLVLLVEDLHWADESTLALLNLLLREARRTPCLLLLTARVRPAGLDAAPTLGRLDLLPLDESASRMLFQFYRPDITEQECGEVLKICAGNPFFLNEIARSNNGGELPTSIQETILGQLEALGTRSKWVAQIAALLGLAMMRRWLETLAGAGGVDAPLAPLLNAGFLVERADGMLAFRHALIQRAIEESLPPRRKMELYAQLGADFVKRFPEDAAHSPELAAHWLTLGADWESALPWRLKAGEKSLAYQALKETVAHWRAALELLKKLPDEKRFAVWEKDIRTRFGPALIMASGFGPESGENYFRLKELCRRLGDAQGEMEALWGAAFFEESRAGQRGVLRFARRMREVSRELGEVLLAPKIVEWQVHTYLSSGLLPKIDALRVEAWLASDAAGIIDPYMFHDAKTAVRVRLGLLAALRGQRGEMLRHIDPTVETLRASGDAPNLAPALTFYLLSLLHVGEIVGVSPLIEELRALTSEKELVVYRGYALGLAAWQLALSGNDLEALPLFEACLEAMRQVLPCHRPKFILQYAESLSRLGSHAEALHQINEAGREIMRYAELYLHPQYLISRARITLAADPARRDAALALLDRAIRVAGHQTSHLFALRAALEKCRITPDNAAARAVLQGLTATFADQAAPFPEVVAARKW